MKRVREIRGGFRAYWCPGCDAPHVLNGGWSYDGNAEAPTFAPSVSVNAGKKNPTAPVCHSFVRAGRVQFLDDCDHALRGKTVDLPPWPEGYRVLE